MPRYFFDVRDGDGTFIDDVGVELQDMDSAVREARKTLGDMLRDALREEEGSDLSLLIRDGADGPILITVTMKTDSPA